MNVRRIRATEWETLRSLRLAALQDAPSAFGSTYEREVAFPDSEWQQRCNAGAATTVRATFIASVGDRPLGLVGAYRDDERSPVELVSMWVAPSARGRGLARELVAAALDWAAGVGADVVGLWVTRGNDAAEALYRSCGFVETGDFQPLPSDPCKDELRMARPVPARRWSPGELITRREVLGLSPILPPPGDSRPWLGEWWISLPVYVVEDTDDALVTFLPPGAPFNFPDGAWPSVDGRHPWFGKRAWAGHGALMVQKPGEHFAVWHFWTGDERRFASWYLNLQCAFVRTAQGYDTQDLELDVIVYPDGAWAYKDMELLDERVAEGRFWPELVEWITAIGADITGRLDASGPWWDLSWAEWEPDPSWVDPLPPPAG